jgi:hypothetical protein
VLNIDQLDDAVFRAVAVAEQGNDEEEIEFAFDRESLVEKRAEMLGGEPTIP